MDFPLFDDMKKHVYDKGMAAGAGDQTGTILYNRGMFQAILAAEAVKVAQKMSGKADITAAEMRVGMENLKVDQAMFSNLGLPNFAPNLSVSCDNHGGAGLVAVQQWDAKAKTWSLVSDFKPTDMDVINMLIAEDSTAYAKENNITPKCL
jgi:branched-chain amino acid transport system substrate-binding protein